MKINGKEVKDSAIIKKTAPRFTAKEAKELSKTFNGMADQKKSAAKKKK